MKIKCKYDDIVSVGQLSELKHPRNYNQHGTEQIELYAEIIRDQGIRRSVRISNLSGYITAGHGLLKTAEYIGYTELPVEYQDYESEDQELADILADNNLARLAVVDRKKRDSIIHELVGKGISSKIIGLPKAVMDDILGNIQKIDLTVGAMPEMNERYGMVDGGDVDYEDDDDDGDDDSLYQDTEPQSDAKKREIENSRKRPIAIVLDKDYYEQWEALKRTKFNVSGDTTAVMKIIDYFNEMMEDV